MSRPYALSRAFAWAAAVLINLIPDCQFSLSSARFGLQLKIGSFCSTFLVPLVTSSLKTVEDVFVILHQILRPLKLSQKRFPPKWSLENFKQKKKNGTRKAKVEGKEENEKPILKPKAYFLRMPELWNLIFCIWKRRREVLDLSTRFWEFVALTCNGQRERYGFVL